MIDWEEIRERCIRTGEFIKIPKEEAVIPSHFTETNLGLSKGEIRQIRDDRATQSLHIHEYPNYYLVHVDIFNPEHHPIAHGILDTPGIALALVGGAIATFCFAKSIRSFHFVPPE